MKPKLNALIIGAGGVASYMLPALNNSFELTGLLVDGDELEEHNLDRQIFGEEQIGEYKANALINHHNLYLSSATEYVDEGWYFRNKELCQEMDVVICLVDNHPARRAALMIARECHIPILICANEYSTSQTMYWHPEWPTESAPDERYEVIRVSNEGSPLRCAGVALESDPQLAIANQVSAGLGNYLLWLWHGDEHFNAENPQGFEPVEFQTTFSKVETTTTQDLGISAPALV